MVAHFPIKNIGKCAPPAGDKVRLTQVNGRGRQESQSKTEQRIGGGSESVSDDLADRIRDKADAKFAAKAASGATAAFGISLATGALDVGKEIFKEYLVEKIIDWYYK